jgi:hypothetical protein
VIEKLADDGGIEVLEGKVRGGLSERLGREGEQQPEGVAVRGDGVATGLSLPHEPVREEPL